MHIEYNIRHTTAVLLVIAHFSRDMVLAFTIVLRMLFASIVRAMLFFLFGVGRLA